MRQRDRENGSLLAVLCALPLLLGLTACDDQMMLARGEAGSTRVVCGDGVREGSEACDDGAQIDGDGCSASCTVEDGWTCSENEAGLSTCRPATPTDCGNGMKEGSEACDDGNKVSGDGCSELCAVEGGFTCSENEVGLSTCQAEILTECGDGVREGSEACDDGNKV